MRVASHLLPSTQTQQHPPRFHEVKTCVSIPLLICRGDEPGLDTYSSRARFCSLLLARQLVWARSDHTAQTLSFNLTTPSAMAALSSPLAPLHHLANDDTPRSASDPFWQTPRSAPGGLATLMTNIQQVSI